MLMVPGRKRIEEIYHNARVKKYPDGSGKLLMCNKAIFKEPGYEDTSFEPKEKKPRFRRESPSVKNLNRAQRRAREKFYDLAKCTFAPESTLFVTLTCDAKKIDRYNVQVIFKKLKVWLSNCVQRNGLTYLLVAEYHKDGAVHFHALFNDVLPKTDSGTLCPPSGGGRPRKPRSEKEREALLAQGWHTVYNLPKWDYGFSTAITLYGEFDRAINYVTKYITKGSNKIGGRWFYQGGDLKRPEVEFCDMDYDANAANPDAYTFEIPQTDLKFASLYIDASTKNTLPASNFAGHTEGVCPLGSFAESFDPWPVVSPVAGCLQAGHY